MTIQMTSFTRSLFGSSTNDKENEACGRTSNLSINTNTTDEDCMTQDNMELDSFSNRCDNADEDITRLRQNSNRISRSDSFKLLQAEASHFFKETSASTSSFVDNAREWGRTASFELGRGTRSLSFSREPSTDSVEDTSTQAAQTPTFDPNSSSSSSSIGNSNGGNVNFRSGPSLERTSSFDLARNIFSASAPDFSLFSRKRSQPPSHEGSSQGMNTPWKRGGKANNNNKLQQQQPSSTDSFSIGKISRMQADYHIIDVIGSGNFGSVYRAKRKLDNVVYAVKQSRQQASNTLEHSSMLREVQTLSFLNNSEENMDTLSSIVRYYSSWIEDDFLYIQMEACEASVDVVYFDAANIDTLLRDMLNALEVVHRHDFAHLDIKPGNILLKNNHYKLCDFGMSLKTDNGVYKGDIDEGDSRYMARELLEWSCSSDLRKCDIFSLGITGECMRCYTGVCNTDFSMFVLHICYLYLLFIL
jgi:hypothetical protein